MPKQEILLKTKQLNYLKSFRYPFEFMSKKNKGIAN